MGKKLTYAQAKKKLDKVFSEWVRRFYSDEDGNARCVSCGVQKPWRVLQAGHYVSRVYLSTRWNERNVAVQCSRCNVLLRGNAVGYSRYLENHYGPSIFAYLDNLSKVPTKYTAQDLVDMIEDYEGRLGRMR